MVELKSLGLCTLLFCMYVDFALGNDAKGHRNHLPQRYQNSGGRDEQGEAVPEREQAPGKPEQAAGRPEHAHRRPEQAPGRPEEAPGKPEQAPGKPEQAPGRGEQVPERGEQVPGRGEQVPGRGEEEERPGDESGRNGKACLCECAGAAGTPHSSYEHVRGFGYYKYHNKAKNWWAAKRECEKEAAHLAIINSPEERDVILKLYKKKPLTGKNPAVFIGINDLAQDGAWVTIFDVPLKETGFEQWNANEPSGKAEQNCGTLQAEFGKLHDHECTNELGFICERESNYVRHCV